MSDQTMLAMVGGGLFSSLFVVPMGRTWVFIAFACFCVVGLSRLH